jgi:class 3 adenylate cyclase
MSDPTYFRADFVQEIISMDESTRTFRAVLRPDPRRYEIIKRGDKELYLDKFFNTAFNLADLVEQSTGLVGAPLYTLQPSVENSRSYAEKRLTALQEEISGGAYSPPSESAVPHQQSISPEEMPITFLSVDICHSTSLRARDANAFDNAYKILFRELATVVGQFQGSIFKATGDGFIAFIEHPSINSQCDAAIDMGLTFIEVLHSGINPALTKNGLPQLSVRVGADHGTAKRVHFSVPSTGFEQIDIASDALNRSVKVQAVSRENNLSIGRTLYERIHVQWLLRSKEIGDLGEKTGLETYNIYEVN